MTCSQRTVFEYRTLLEENALNSINPCDQHFADVSFLWLHFLRKCVFGESFQRNPNRDQVIYGIGIQVVVVLYLLNPLKPDHCGPHFADDFFKCIFSDENFWILIQVSLKFYSKGPFETPCSDVTWALWRLKSPANWVFAQQFIQANIVNGIKGPHYWSLVKEIHR